MVRFSSGASQFSVGAGTSVDIETAFEIAGIKDGSIGFFGLIAFHAEGRHAKGDVARGSGSAQGPKFAFTGDLLDGEAKGDGNRAGKGDSGVGSIGWFDADFGFDDTLQLGQVDADFGPMR